VRDGFTFFEGDVKDRTAVPVEDGSVAVGSDLYTATSYDPDLSAVLQRELDMLKVGGHWFWTLADGRGQDAPVQIKCKDGSWKSLRQWIGSLPGVRVVSDGPVIRGTWFGGWRLGVKKIGPVQVPKLRLVGFLEGGPPMRVLVEE
jgi:hypothetical protein